MTLLVQLLPDTARSGVEARKEDRIGDVLHRAADCKIIDFTTFQDIHSWALGNTRRDRASGDDFNPKLADLLPWKANDVLVFTPDTVEELTRVEWTGPMRKLVDACEQAGIKVERHVLDQFSSSVPLSNMLSLCYSPSTFVRVYHHAAALLHTDTKRSIALTTRGLVVADIYPTLSTSALFYRAAQRGSPRLLKLGTAEKPRIAQEAAIFHSLRQWAEAQTPPNPLLHLMPLEVISFNRRPTSPSGHTHGLLSPVYVSTLSDYPLDVSMSELHANAAVCVERALATMHAAGVIHCDVKPDNIFVDSSGECVLGDYDAARDMGLTVLRTSAKYWPADLLVRHASAALDYAMLAMTLLQCLGEQLRPDSHEHTLAWMASFGRKAPQLFIEEQGFEQACEEQRQRMVASIERIIEIVMRCHARVIADLPQCRLECHGLVCDR